jgi:membrane-bound lytic murein transglycosylase MltF
MPRARDSGFISTSRGRLCQLGAGVFSVILGLQGSLASPARSSARETDGKRVLTVRLTQQQAAPQLPLPYEHWTGDLDGMVKRREIRALVAYSKTAFFYDRGRPEGITYEALRDFQTWLNEHFKTGNLPIVVTFFPVGYEHLEEYLNNGTGDLIAVPVADTPEREQKVRFTVPIVTGAREVVVTGSGSSPLTNLDDLSGKTVYVNPLTVYGASLDRLNNSLKAQGKKPVIVRPADANLGDEDLLEMVNAGLIPATVTIDMRARFWATVLPGLRVCSLCTLSAKENLAWAVRKDSPELQRSLNEFVESRKEGTAFGNTLIRRYLRNTQWVKNATSDEEKRKFKTYVALFRKYGAEYNFDYLMLIALSYQESGLDQERTNPTGATGLMQVIPRDAAASPIHIEDVRLAEQNVHAGTKMLRYIEDTYFPNQNIDPLNKTLLTFASYNAGPSRIAELRRETQREGLNPNVWFGNVEMVVARNVGQQTVRYVSNIYKYYVCYKLVVEESGGIERLEEPTGP